MRFVMVVNSRVDQKKVLLKFCKGKGKVAETALVDSPPPAKRKTRKISIVIKHPALIAELLPVLVSDRSLCVIFYKKVIVWGGFRLLLESIVNFC